VCATVMAVADSGGEEESSFPPFIFISIINVMECLGGWFTLFLFLFWLI
jgi:hypothetical protein